MEPALSNSSARFRGADDGDRYFRIDGESERAIEDSTTLFADVSKQAVQVDFVLLTPRELGFKSPPKPWDFMNADFCLTWSKNLKRQSIGLCNMGDGPQIRAHYGEQPIEDKVYVAARQIYDHAGVPCVFALGVYERVGPWLMLSRMYEASEVPLDEKYVFRLHTEQ